MRRPIILALGVLAVLGVGAATFFYSKYRKSDADFQSMVAEEANTRLRYGQAINEIATIQDSLNTIVLGEEAARLQPSPLQSELGTSATNGDQAIARIALLKAGIERTKVRIQELDTRLRESGVKIAGLQKLITRLRTAVAEKEQYVASLTVQRDSLQTRVAGLTTELGTVLYVIGTKKDLLGSGVVVAKGGVLGVGKTLEPSGLVDETMFTALDTDAQSVIQIPAERAQVVSAQPVTSYVLQPIEGSGMVELRIVEPKEFRKVKHLVIVTA